MKYLSITLFCIGALLLSCSEDVRFNRKIDGTWNATEFMGQYATNKTTFKMTFEKEERKGGYGVIFISSDKNEYTEGFTYTVDHQHLNLFSSSNFYFFEIISWSKKKIELIDASNERTTLIRE